MALIKGGRARMGQKLYSPQADGKVITCSVSDVVFYDKEGERTRG